MGLDVYLENQVHERTYAGQEVGASFSRVLEAVGRVGLLAGVDDYGDTMFNVIQLTQLRRELDAELRAHPELEADVRALMEVFERVDFARGYLWVLGD